MIKHIYGAEVETIQGRVMSLEAYRGKVILVVNTASACGFSRQLEGLETLYRRFEKLGFVVLGFPCNQFGNQEPGTSEEIQRFCKSQFAITFPMHTKVTVNGDQQHPLFERLKEDAPGLMGITAIKWNFTKFLIDRDGQVVQRFSPSVEPEQLTAKVEALLTKAQRSTNVIVEPS